MNVRIINGDCRSELAGMPDNSADCCVTSPPYFGLRDYGVAGQIGLEATPAEYVAELVAVFRQVRRVLSDDGTLWLNLGDSYANDGKSGGSTGGKHVSALHGSSGPGRAKKTTGLKQKDLIGIPWRVAFALQEDGWYLRQDIIWSKPNPMPESVTDRCTKAHEYLFLLSKSPRYYFDADAIAEPVAESSIARLAQDVDNQAGSSRVPGKTNGAVKAVIKASPRDNFKRENSKRAAVHPGQTMGTHRPDRPDSLFTGTRNKRSVWTVATQPYSEAHFATFPTELIEPCILAGSRKGGMILDPFGGAGTTALVADRLGRNAISIELNPDYVALQRRRIEDDAGMFAKVVAA